MFSNLNFFINFVFRFFLKNFLFEIQKFFLNYLQKYILIFNFLNPNPTLHPPLPPFPPSNINHKSRLVKHKHRHKKWY